MPDSSLRVDSQFSSHEGDRHPAAADAPQHEQRQHGGTPVWCLECLSRHSPDEPHARIPSSGPVDGSSTIRDGGEVRRAVGGFLSALAPLVERIAGPKVGAALRAGAVVAQDEALASEVGEVGRSLTVLGKSAVTRGVVSKGTRHVFPSRDPP